MRLCLRRNVKAIQQNLPHAGQSQINALKILSQLPKTTRRHEGKEGTPSLHKHTMSTTKNSKETGIKRARRATSFSFVSLSRFFLLLSQPVHGEKKGFAAVTRGLAAHVPPSFLSPHRHSTALVHGPTSPPRLFPTRLSFIRRLRDGRLCEFGFWILT